MSRDFDRQVAELQIRAAILNRFTALGTPLTLRAGWVCPGKGELRPSQNSRDKAPTTEKCSSVRSGATSRWARIAAITLRHTSVVGSRSRFFVKAVGTQTGSASLCAPQDRHS